MSETIGKCDVCRAAATLRCTCCRSIYYCGRVHQRQDWRRHNAVCKAFEIISNPELGRHLIAARDIQEGSIILVQNPYVIGPMELSSAYHCVGCYRAMKRVVARCPGCRLPACKRTCPGLKDSAGHSLECIIFKRKPAPGSDLVWPTIGLFLRCVRLQKACPEMWQWIVERAPYASHKRLNKHNSQRTLLMNMVQPTLERFAIAGGDLLLDSSLETFDQIIDVLDVFALDVFLNENDKVSALYPVASLLQQSCAPNTRLSSVVDSSTSDADELKIGRVTVQAARYISKGEVLTYTCLPTTMTTLARQAYLLQYRSTRCSCIRCLDPRELGSDFGTIKCTTCSGWMLPVDTVDIVGSEWRCGGKCGVILSNDEAASRQVQLLEKMSNVISNKVSFQKLEELLKDFEKNFHPNNWSCVHLKRAMMKVYSIAPTLLGNKDHLSRTLDSYGIALNPVYKIPVSRLERKAALCRDIMDVMDRISADVCVDDLIPTADILLHLASAEGELMKLKFMSKKVDRDEILVSFERCEALLRRAEKLVTRIPDKIAETVAEDIENEKKRLAFWAYENRLKKTEEPAVKIRKHV